MASFSPGVLRLGVAALFSFLLHIFVLQILAFGVSLPGAGGLARRLVVTISPPAFTENARAQTESVDRRLVDEIEKSGGVLGAAGLGGTTRNPVAELGSGYWPIRSLTKLPRPIGEIDLNTPEITLSAQAAELTLRVLLSVAGEVEYVEVVGDRADSQSIEWVSRIVERFRQARFHPGEIGNKPVPTEFMITVVVD